MKLKHIKRQLISTARKLGIRESKTLQALKKERSQLKRPDFVWHYLLQSFATMGKASGWQGLIGNRANYEKVKFEALARIDRKRRRVLVDEVCRAAKIRMPGKKAQYILGCFEKVQALGGPEAARDALLACDGRDGKIAFLKAFPGIGDKYARNIMMDVYHEEFHDCIAVDARIKGLSEAFGLTFGSYSEHEAFYISVAHEAGLSGWELDRLIFNYTREFIRDTGKH